MLKEERLDWILTRLRADRKVLSSVLSQELGVSEDTIRRDLNELSESGLIQKVHGGALPRSPNPYRWDERVGYASEEKGILAAKAVSLLSEGQLVILDGGTTNLQVARLLPPALKLTILTNDLSIATQLLTHPNAEVVLLGGRVFKNSHVTVGDESVQVLRGIRADVCLLGVCSIHPTVGITAPDREEAVVKRAMVAASAQVVALVTADKLNTAEHYVVCHPPQLHTLLIDDKTAGDDLEAYRSQGIRVQ